MSETEFNELFSSNLKMYLGLREKTQADLARYLGVSTAAVNTWCRGLKAPRMDKVDGACKFLNCKRSDLMMDHSSAEYKELKSTFQLSHEEEIVLMSYRKLNHIGKEKALEYISDLAGNEKYIKDTPGTKINVG